MCECAIRGVNKSLTAGRIAPFFFSFFSFTFAVEINKMYWLADWKSAYFTLTRQIIHMSHERRCLSPSLTVHNRSTVHSVTLNNTACRFLSLSLSHTHTHTHTCTEAELLTTAIGLSLSFSILLYDSHNHHRLPLSIPPSSLSPLAFSLPHSCSDWISFTFVRVQYVRYRTDLLVLIQVVFTLLSHLLIDMYGFEHKRQINKDDAKKSRTSDCFFCFFFQAWWWWEFCQPCSSRTEICVSLPWLSGASLTL